MNILKTSPILVFLVSSIMLTGCKNYFETRAACVEKYGGSRLDCRQLNQRNQHKAEQSRREQAKYNLKVGRLNSKSRWNSKELSSARRENLQAIRTRYPKFGWMSGVWCGSDRRRITITGPGQMRIARYDTSGLSYGFAHVRARGNKIEIWAYDDLWIHGVDLSKYGSWSMNEIRKKSQDKFSITLHKSLKTKSVNRNVPFSGVIDRVSRYTSNFSRCTHSPTAAAGYYDKK